MKIGFIISLWVLLLIVAAIDCGTRPPPPPPEPPLAATEPDTAALILPPALPDTIPFLPLTLASIYFEFNSAAISPAAAVILDGNGQALLQHPSATLRIEGNCDERGGEEYNLILGQERADAARGYLINFGIDSLRITTISNGKDRPLASGRDKGVLAENRRDDFIVLSQ
jgi:peptidoglycan-associated lipoprotein